MRPVFGRRSESCYSVDSDVPPTSPRPARAADLLLSVTDHTCSGGVKYLTADTGCALFLASFVPAGSNRQSAVAVDSPWLLESWGWRTCWHSRASGRCIHCLSGLTRTLAMRSPGVHKPGLWAPQVGPAPCAKLVKILNMQCGGCRPHACCVRFRCIKCTGLLCVVQTLALSVKRIHKNV
jgi:hypothetical protein